MTEPIALSGAPGSPYTRKMLAVLRYRHIPYRYLPTVGPAVEGLPRAKVPLLPTFYLPDGNGELQAVTDSTPLIRRFEGEYAGRSIVPADPALRFIDELIEDYGDEWLTKCMFHYRWVRAEDADKAAAILPVYRGLSVSDEALTAAGRAFAERQIGRLGYVGSNAVTGPVIEASYLRFLKAFDAHLTVQPFILGTRPASCDFAVFGQLSQLALFDPTPMALTLATAPRVLAWTEMMEDQCGLEPADDGWLALSAQPPTLTGLLKEIGRAYAPVMLANAAAIAADAGSVEGIVDGQRWTQAPFPYQSKCLRWLRQSYGALTGADKAAADAALQGTGCEALFA